jgi:hypothetical protein
VDEEVLNPAPQSLSQDVALRPLSHFSILLTAILDSFSFALFCLSFSGLTQMLTSFYSRLFAQE